MTLQQTSMLKHDLTVGRANTVTTAQLHCYAIFTKKLFLTVGHANIVTTAQTTLLCNLYKETVTLSLLGVIRKEENFHAITYCTFMNVEKK